MKVFLDANILFSASSVTSVTRKLLMAVLCNGQAVTGSHAWEEALRNIRRKRPENLPNLHDLKAQVSITYAFTTFSEGSSLPDEDKPILGGAIAAGCTHLWTSDKRHFVSLYGKRIQGVSIVSSVMLADEIMERGGKL